MVTKKVNLMSKVKVNEKTVSLESFVMRSRKSDSMELQRKSCLYLFFFFFPLKRSHLYVAQFLE